MRGRLRIIGGQWGGRQVAVKTAPGLRPTADRNRETLFNWLQAHCPGARALDLFAGTGALGLEALSRGASAVTFVERSRVAAGALKQLIETLGADDRARVVIGDALAFLPKASGPYDLVFLDPPFSQSLLLPALTALAAHSLLAADARVYVESSAKLELAAIPDGWRISREKKAGAVWFGLLAPVG